MTDRDALRSNEEANQDPPEEHLECERCGDDFSSGYTFPMECGTCHDTFCDGCYEDHECEADEECGDDDTG